MVVHCQLVYFSVSIDITFLVSFRIIISPPHYKSREQILCCVCVGGWIFVSVHCTCVMVEKCLYIKTHSTVQYINAVNTDLFTYIQLVCKGM